MNRSSAGNEGGFAVPPPQNLAPFWTHEPILLLCPYHVCSVPGHQANTEVLARRLGHCHWNGAKGWMASAKQLGRWRPARRQQIRWNRGVHSLQMGENLFNDRRPFDAYMDPSRFAKHMFVRDKKKVATIYPYIVSSHFARYPAVDGRDRIAVVYATC